MDYSGEDKAPPHLVVVAEREEREVIRAIKHEDSLQLLHGLQWKTKRHLTLSSCPSGRSVAQKPWSLARYGGNSTGSAALWRR